MRQAFNPDFELEWSGHTAFRGIFPASLVENIEGVPLDSTHWWGPDTNFFATRLARDLFTVQGGIYADPKDPVAIAKFRDGAPWDQEANVKLLQEKYVVSCQKSRFRIQSNHNLRTGIQLSEHLQTQHPIFVITPTTSVAPPSQPGFSVTESH